MRSSVAVEPPDAGVSRPGVLARVALAVAAALVAWQAGRAAIMEWRRVAARGSEIRDVVLSGSIDERFARLEPAYLAIELVRAHVPLRTPVWIVADPASIAGMRAEIVVALHPRGVEFVPALLPEHVQPVRRRGGWMLVDESDAAVLAGVAEEAHARGAWRLVRIRAADRR